MCYTMTLSTDFTIIPSKSILGLKGLSRVMHIILPTASFYINMETKLCSNHPRRPRAGLLLRFQVAGYLLLVAGEVASSRGVPRSRKKFLKCNFYCFPKGITVQKKQSSSRAELSLAVL